MKYSKVKNNLLPVLAKTGSIRHFHAGEMIYFQDEDQNSFCFVRKGRVRAFFNSDDGQEMTLEIIGEGRIFGENTLLSESGRLNSMQAVSDVELISCTLEELLPVLHEYPELMKIVFELMAQTVSNLSRQVLRLSFMNAPSRIADYLLQVSEDPDPSLNIHNGVLPYTHTDLALSVNLTRSTVSRILREFEKSGLIESGYGKIRILNPEGLKLVIEKESGN